jgi:16S rRNA (guanine527-N7)-methyltransferase
MPNKNEKELLQTALKANGCYFSEKTQQQFLNYLHLLQEWNRIYNLTAITEMHDMIYLHLLDSLSINPYFRGTRIIDVGTGAGFPGIPLALINPEKQFVLLDSNSKKTRFLTQAVFDLDIKNIEVIHARCEDYIPEKKFDSVVSRAFASLKHMLENTRHLVAEHGQFLAMKGVYPKQEIEDIPKEFKLIAVHRLMIQGLTAERCLVCLQK